MVANIAATGKVIKPVAIQPAILSRLPIVNAPMTSERAVISIMIAITGTATTMRRQA